MLKYSTRNGTQQNYVSDLLQDHVEEDVFQRALRGWNLINSGQNYLVTRLAIHCGALQPSPQETATKLAQDMMEDVSAL
jgi:hypothetical protein